VSQFEILSATKTATIKVRKAAIRTIAAPLVDTPTNLLAVADAVIE
jgi:outer membrane receptor for monomeric catechols